MSTDDPALQEAFVERVKFELEYVAHILHQHSNLCGRLVAGAIMAGDALTVTLETGEARQAYVFSLERDIDGVLRGRHVERVAAPCIICAYVRGVEQQPIKVPQTVTEVAGS